MMWWAEWNNFAGTLKFQDGPCRGNLIWIKIYCMYIFEIYPLVNKNSYWTWPFYSGFTHKKWWFSIVMLVYQRVYGCIRDLSMEGVTAYTHWPLSESDSLPFSSSPACLWMISEGLRLSQTAGIEQLWTIEPWNILPVPEWCTVTSSLESALATRKPMKLQEERKTINKIE